MFAFSIVSAAALALPLAEPLSVGAPWAVRPAASTRVTASDGLAQVDSTGVAVVPEPGAWTTPSAEGATRGFVFASDLARALGSDTIERVRAEVPVAELGTLKLRLVKFRGVAPDVRVEIAGAQKARALELSALAQGLVHLEGKVDGYAGSSCYLAFGSTGAAGWIDLGDGRGHFTLRRVGSDVRGLCAGTVEFARASGTSAPDVPTCGGALEAGDGGTAGFGALQAGVRPVVELAVDMDYDMRANFASNEAATEYTGALVGAVSAIYRRDVGASVQLVYLRIYNDPADLFNEPDPLGPFRDYWESAGGKVDRDLFTLFTGRRNLPYGGVAWLSAACGSYGYSVNGYLNGVFADPVATNPGNWDINVVAHEIGHNVGTLHTHDYSIDGCASGTVQRGTIMSYCHVVSGASSNIDLRFHRGTAVPIESFMAGAACLASDCNDNGIEDAEEIAASPALDGNGDQILDACQDCDSNGVPDPVQIASGASADADGDGLPDACEADCDGDGIPDSIEISLNAALDADGDMTLDACQLDCDGDGVADAVQILSNMALDRSRDGRLDACEDCDGDGVSDFVELQGSKSRWVASAGDNLLRELDPRSGVLRRTVDAGASPRDLAIGPDGRLYIAVQNEVRVFDRVSGTSVNGWAASLAGQARAVAVAPSGQMAVLLDTGAIALLNSSGGFVQNLVGAIPGSLDSRDLVFRTAPGGATEAIVTQGNGLVLRVTWPGGVRSVFCDLTALNPALRGAYAMADGSILVAASALNAVHRIASDGTHLGEWDVDNGALVNGAYAIADAGDGRAVLVTGPNSSSTINGFRLTNGYTERTYRVYPADAPQATALVIAPASATDANGNLFPDECELPPADLNGDGLVNGADLSILLSAWGPCPGSCPADLNDDGSVGAADLAILLNLWGS